LIITPSWLQAFRTAIAESASSTAAALERSGTFPWDLSISRAAFCGLSDFPAQSVFCDQGTMASVIVSHHGKLVGTSLISLEPRHAFELIRSLGAEGDPLDIFRTLGASLLRGMLGSLGAAEDSQVEFGNPALKEASLVATVLGTHAPPDTMVVSAEVGFVSAKRAFPAYLYLLLDAKAMQSSLGYLGER
jgi:hypothetical protein